MSLNCPHIACRFNKKPSAFSNATLNLVNLDKLSSVFEFFYKVIDSERNVNEHHCRNSLPNPPEKEPDGCTESNVNDQRFFHPNNPLYF